MASPYLYPCAIEFSLICAAVIYKIYTNVGAQLNRDNTRRHMMGNMITSSMTGECHKANSGLFLGLLLLTSNVLGVFFFLFHDGGGEPLSSRLAIFIYFINDYIVQGLALIALVLVYIKMSKLTFTKGLESKFDQNLILIALVGHYLLFLFLLIPAIAASGKVPGVLNTYANLQIGICFLTLIEATVQVIFIVDGLRRRSANIAHFQNMPGRSVITFLILCNLSMWIINTFELKEIHRSYVHIEFYGQLAWIIIVHICLPLTIFFRFHSCICFAEIWQTAYKKDSDHPKLVKSNQNENML